MANVTKAASPSATGRLAALASRWDRCATAPWALPAAFGLLVAVILWNAWVCDDAYITFRVADNFLEGHGLRWNVEERVQAYSNPLWLLLFVAVYGLLGNAYAAAIAMGVGCTLGALWLARRVAAAPGLLVFGILLCLLSKATVDYATSGLENPLAFLLLAAITGGLFRLETQGRPTPRACFLLAAGCGLLMLNRLDAGLFAAPVCGYLLWRRPGGKGIAGMALGLLPLVAWLAFATLYYGFLFPNTAYAKLQNGWSGEALVGQGFCYLFESLAQDPITLATIAVALGSALLRRSPARWVLALGIALHLLYVIKIGGDFMSGRFLTAPFFVAVLLLITAPTGEPTAAWSRGWSGRAVAIAGLLLFAGLVNPNGTLLNRPFWRGELTTREAAALYLDPYEHGICDERAFYYPTCGLARWPWLRRLPDHDFREQGERVRAKTQQPPPGQPPDRLTRTGMVRGNIGMTGFFAGPRVDIVDPAALADAFLARLPPSRPGHRIGHIVREVPPEYLASRQSGSNRFTDAAMREFYDRITLVTRGPVLDPARLGVVWAMNLP